MSKISAVLAVYNEEDSLSECLKSVKGLANEIIIVDGGSTDRTLEIARNFNAKIIETDNPTIFHKNKNKAIDVASGYWILQLDADERVTPKLVEEIRNVISKDNNINGYWIPRKNFFLNRFLKKGGQYPDYTLRLYKKGKGRLPAQDVHEQAVVEGEVGYLKNDLLHYRDTSFKKYLEGLDRYTSIISMQLKQQGTSFSIFNMVRYMIIKPIEWFLKTYIRHKGYVDGFPGLVFALFSSLRFPLSYMKLLNNRLRKIK